MKYLLIGDGRVAQHMSHYLELLKLPFATWSRRNPYHFHEKLHDCTHVLLLIRDDAVEEFADHHPELRTKVCVHFSGSLLTTRAHSCHPLMTFSHQLYDLETYKKIPFVCEKEGPTPEQLLPGFPNRFFQIPRADKSLYHALCVLSGNFTQLLWQKFFNELRRRWDIPASSGFPYLEQTTKNLEELGAEAFTGPLARHDQKTIENNLAALKNDPYNQVYQAFVTVFQAEK